LLLSSLCTVACASSLTKPSHPDGLARILIGEESRIAELCVQLDRGAGEGGDRLLADETARDACRLARALDPSLGSRCDLASAKQAIEASMASGPPPWLKLVVGASGAWDGKVFDAEVYAAKFDFSRVLARKIAEVGDRAAAFSDQVTQGFGRLAGVVGSGVDLLVAETTAASMERLFDQPAVRALAEPTEVARNSCRQLDDGQSRPLATRRILKRSILRLDPPGEVTSPGSLCAADVRPGACDRLVGSVRGAAASSAVDAACGGSKHRAACDHLWFLVAMAQATELETLCKRDDAPASCKRLADERRAGQKIDDVCGDAKLPHERGTCRAAVRHYAALDLWHPNAAQNVCWKNPSRCARIKRRIMPEGPAAAPLTPVLPERPAEPAPVEGIESCFVAAEKVCGSRCPEGGGACDDGMRCVTAVCELVATRGDAVDVEDPAAIAELSAIVRAQDRGGQIGRADLLPIVGALDESLRLDRAVAEGVGRLPSTLATSLRDAVAGLGRSAGDAETLRRLEIVLAELRAKQDRRDRAVARQRELAERLDAAAKAAGFRVRATEAGVSVVLTNVLFEDASSDLSEDARAQVCSVAQALGSSDAATLLGTDYRIEIVGFSSPTGIVTSKRKEDSNMLLSIDRAYAAYDWLTKNPDKPESRCAGARCRDSRACSSTIPQDRVQVTGRGYNDPQVGTDESLRRVEIHVVLPGLAPE
jgi:outer membrane protein OmpA-like peptidoglycan-associated protein